MNDLVKTLFVGNLPWNTTPDELTSFFSEHGKVITSRIIADRDTGRSKGYGFVEVEDEDVGTVVNAMNGKDFKGREITVNEAKPKQ